MSNPLYRLYVAHVEWKGRRKELNGQEHRFLHRWVARVYPELINLLGDGAQFRQQCMEIQRGGKPPSSPGIGMATLEHYSDQLVTLYLSSPDYQSKPFSAFLEDVLKRCKSETTLQEFLSEGLGRP